MCTKIHRGSHPGLHCYYSGKAPKVRRVYRVAGIGSHLDFGVHNNSMANLRRGLMERVFYVEREGELVSPPRPTRGIFKSLNQYKRQIVALMGQQHKMSREQFLGFYTGPKLTLYTGAVASLAERPLMSGDAELKTFVKAEKINFTKKPDPAPRVIQPRAPRFNVELGCYLRHIEHKIYHQIDRLWGHTTVMKGLNVMEQGKIISRKCQNYGDFVAIGFDMKRFDQHVSRDALMFEHSIYKSLYSYDPYLCELLSWQLDNRGVGYASDGAIKYKVSGCRMSGDMNTALGNVILTGLMTKLFVDKHKLDAQLVNQGDDCVLVLGREGMDVVLNNITGFFLEFGFQVVCEPPVFEIEHIEFCQMHPVHDGDDYVMVRTPSVSLAKDCTSITPFNTIKTARQWINAVGQCGIALTGGIPVLQAWYTILTRHGLGGSNILTSKDFHPGLRYMASLAKRKRADIKPYARYSYWKAFGLTPDEQIALEQQCDDTKLEMDFDIPGNSTHSDQTWNHPNQQN